MPGAIVKRSATNYAVKIYVGQGKSKWHSGLRTRREAQAFQVSMAVRHGASVKLVQERLGHATPAFTMRTYVHNAPGQQAEAVRLISGLLESATHLQPNLGTQNGEAANLTRGYE